MTEKQINSFPKEENKTYLQRFSVRKNQFSDDVFQEEIVNIQNLVNEGVSHLAVEKAVALLKQKPQDRNTLAKINLLLSKSLELQARYQDSLEILQVYETEDASLDLETELAFEIRVQIAVLLNYLTDSPKSVSLLKQILEDAAQLSVSKDLYGRIFVSLSRAYRLMGENVIAREMSEKSLTNYRETGNWRGMVQAYVSLSNIVGQEGKWEEFIEFCLQILQIIGDKSDTYWLGRVYSDLGGAYYMLRRPHEGIACLERATKYFEKTEHHANAISAHNNLGLNLMVIGEWRRAEESFQTALKIAENIKHSSLPVINDSLGDLYLLRGDFEKAEFHLSQALDLSREQNHKWYESQALHTFSRYRIAQKDFSDAANYAKKYLEVANEIKDRDSIRKAHLLLADIYRYENKWTEFEAELAQAKAKNDGEPDLLSEASSQFLLAQFAKYNKDLQLAEHHFNRSLSIYEMLSDFYHINLCKFEICLILSANNPKTAIENIKTPLENFRKIQAVPLINKAEEALQNIKQFSGDEDKTPADVGLLTLRLAEAAFSRELLLKEFLTVLQSETTAKKILIVTKNQDNKLIPKVFRGFTTAESNEIAADLTKSNDSVDSKNSTFADKYSVVKLADSTVLLVIYPRLSDKTFNGSLMRSLLKVVELGLENCDYREQEKLNKLNEKEVFKSDMGMPGFIHSSPAMTQVVEEIYKIRNSDVTVLITGKSGTGKELVSRAIHNISLRKAKIFMPFNCTAIPKDLAEGHLFGYRRGAFTGAVNDHEGVIRSANGGTLFLDEIGDLPLDVQPKLLRFLQEGEIQPLGEKKPLKVDVRVIAATNVGLEQQVKEGNFREDLYYRLNVIRLRVPPLRERRSEIPPLINYYIEHYSEKFGKKDLKITPQAVDLLMVCDWEGNVRQLTNEIQRIVVRAENGEIISVEHISEQLRRNNSQFSSAIEKNNTQDSSANVFNLENANGTLDEIVAQIEYKLISDSLKRHSGNVSRVARELKISRRGLYTKLDRYQLNKSA